jgi:hypothetical protein
VDEGKPFGYEMLQAEVFTQTTNQSPELDYDSNLRHSP